MLLFSYYVMFNSCDPMDCSPPGSSIHFPGKNTRSGYLFPSPGDLSDPGIKPISPILAGRFLTTEPQGKSYIYIDIRMYLYFFSCVCVCVCNNHFAVSRN